MFRLAAIATLTAATLAAMSGAARADQPATIAQLGEEASSITMSDRPERDHALKCLAIAAALEKSGTPASTPVKLTMNAGHLPKGTATFAEVKAECAAVRNASVIAGLESGPFSLGSVLWHAGRLDPADSHSINDLEPYVHGCEKAMEDVKTFGIDPATSVKTKYDNVEWTGTVADAQTQVCGKAREAIKAAVMAQLAPYTDLGIAGDKLDLIANYYPLGFYIPGGSYSSGDTDPKLLKKANVWFVISEGDYCALDKIEYTFHRYQFDKNQKIAKESSRTYCGDPGPKAVK